MLSRQRKTKSLVFRWPDLVAARGDRKLLVWKDIPHWTVVDEELFRLLEMLDGSRSLDDIICERPEWKGTLKEIDSALRSLRKAGVVIDSQEHPVQPTAISTGSVPIENIAINLTRRCNLRCRFCYNLEWLTPEKDPELSVSEIKEFLSSIITHLGKKPSLTILGGEPLLRADDLLELAQFALRRRFNVLVSTNGTLITDEFAAKARKTGLEVQVSLDGHSGELNDAVRGFGSYDKAIKGVETLVRNGVHTIISMVCHNGNLPYLERFYELALSLGVNEARFIPLKSIGGGKGNDFKPVSHRDIIQTAYDMFQRRPELLRLAGRDAFSIIGNMCRYSIRRNSCGTGVQTFLLDSDGSIYPCLNTNLPEFRIGNIHDHKFDFEKIWPDSTILRNFRMQTAVCEANGVCSDCVVRHWCAGGCRGETYITTGSISGKPKGCADLKETIIKMMWILSERPDLVKNTQTPGRE